MSSSTPEITVAMPAYNAASHLLEAIESILAQSFEDFELLVVDDGSTDNTLALAQSCADKRVRVERLPANKGRATARNMAMGRARGRYLAWMDADDIAMPHRLEAQYAPGAERVSHTDGLSVEYADWRFNVRTSNTEPLMRLNVESRGDVALMQAKTKEILALLEATDEPRV